MSWSMLLPVHASCPSSSCSPARGSPRPSSPPTPRTCGSCDEAFHRPPAHSSPPKHVLQLMQSQLQAMESIHSLHFEMVPATPCHLLASENSLHLAQVEKRSCSDLTEKNTRPTCWTDCAQGGHCWSATAAEGHRLPEALLSCKALRCCISSKFSLLSKDRTWVQALTKPQDRR